MDTAPLPVVADGPEPRPIRLRGAARWLEHAAGAVSAGLVVVGLTLVALQILAPQLTSGQGFAAAAGPTWWRASIQLCVGLLGEGVVVARRRLGRAARVWSAVGVLAAAGAVLWWCWWV